MSARFDSVGLWWEDYEQPKTRATQSAHAVRLVAVPETGWTPPRDLPNLSGARVLGLDIESKDLQLLDKGPGFVRGAAHVVGVSLATEDKAWYFPIRHEYQPQLGMNLDPDMLLQWVGEQLQVNRPIIGANLLYDLEGLRAAGVPSPKGRLLDVQFAEPLLDEQRRTYALDELARIHLGTGKTTSDLYSWCSQSFGGEPDQSQRANIWRAPPSLTGPYAEADALLPVQVLAKQQVLLSDEGLGDVFDMECRLIPLLLDMRFRGVRIDVERAQRTADWLRAQAKAAQGKIPGVDVWSAASLERAFKAGGYEVLYTEAGNPSFTKAWLESCHHDLAQAVLDVRLMEKAANPFVESYLLQNVHNGRVHCQFHPLRSDQYGTVAGRFSSSNPNLQNIPSRHKIIGPALRSLYIPEEGSRWKRADHSQIEYRSLVHYAVGPGAEELRQRYRSDPTTDFHQLTIQMVEEITGVKLDRTPAKNLNFGLVYGMGKDKTTRSLGVSQDVGERLYDAYFAALPAVKETNRSAARLASRRGYIKTILGRRRRFTQMEEGRFGGMQRVGTHAALNACLQGTAAEIMKMGMLQCYEAGLFAEDACGVPHLTVHDELDWSQQPGVRAAAAFAEAKHVLENCIKLKVPLLVQMSEGANWGECK